MCVYVFIRYIFGFCGEKKNVEKKFDFIAFELLLIHLKWNNG